MGRFTRVKRTILYAAVVLFLYEMSLLYTSFNCGEMSISEPTSSHSSKVGLLSDRENIFSNDDVPDRYSRRNIDSEDTILFCLVTAKEDIAEEAEIFVKSVLLHARRSDVFFHFIVYEGSEKTIPKIFDHINCAFVNVNYDFVYVDLREYVTRKLHHILFISHKYSGVYGLGKLFMFDIMSHVDICMIVDTDVVFGVDPAFLWSDLQTYWRTGIAVAAAHWTNGTFNTGLMVHNLALMRRMKFHRLISLDTDCRKNEFYNRTMYRCSHDQDLLNSIYNRYPGLFLFFSKSWNLGWCKHFYDFKFDSLEDRRTNLFFGAAHFTCIPLRHQSAFEGFVSFQTRHGSQFLYLTEYLLYLKSLSFLSKQGSVCQKGKILHRNTTFDLSKIK